MGSAGPSGGYVDLHTFFKGPSGSPHPAYPTPSNPYPQAPPVYSYPTPSNLPPNPGAYGFSTPPTASYYVHFGGGQDLNPRPPPFPPFPQLPSSHSLPHASEPQVPVQGVQPASSPTLDGARLMALLTTSSAVEGDMAGSLELPEGSRAGPGPGLPTVAPPAIAPAIPTAPPVHSLATPSGPRMPARRGQGRSISGSKVVYDIDVRLPGEAQPQLEVQPITVYTSENVMVVGRQIAVNSEYICYGLRGGNIRILNIHTGLRALLRGHSLRMTDMAFLAPNLHFVASASSDGRVFVREIVADGGEDGKTQIRDKIILALLLKGDWESAHPLVCWHSHMQKTLYVGIGKYLVEINISAAGRLAPPGGFTVDNPVEFDVNRPPEGIFAVCGHEGDVTSLAVTDKFPNCVATASKDGVVRFWVSNKTPLMTLIPHNRQPVGTVAFLAAPGGPASSGGVLLLTAGPLNRELKLWAQRSSGVPSSPASRGWICFQTLELQSSAETAYDRAFFNQVVVLPHASLILLANAKKNALYAIHVEVDAHGNPRRMDYIAEFSVTMPVLSLTATINEEAMVQVYCVQTQAIQLYALDMTQCSPSPDESGSSSPNSEGNIGSVGSPALQNLSGTLTSEATVASSSSSYQSGLDVGRPMNVDNSVDFETPVDHSVDQAPVTSDVSRAISLDLTEDSIAEGSSAPVKDGASTPEEVPFNEEQNVSETEVHSSSRSGHEVGSSTSALADTNNHKPEKQVEEEGLETRAELPPSDDDGERVSDNSTLSQVVQLVGFSEEELQDTPRPMLSGGAASAHSLLTPSQLMQMAQGSTVGQGSSPPLSSPVSRPAGGDLGLDEKKVEYTTFNVEMDKVLGPESSTAILEVSGDQEVFRDSSALSSDVSREKTQIPVQDRMSITSNEEDAADEASLVLDGEAYEERDSSVLHVREGQEVLKESSVTRSDVIRTALPSPASGAAKGRKNKNKANISGVGIPVVSEATSMRSSVVPTASTVVSSEGEPSVSTSSRPNTIEGLATQAIAMQDTLNQLMVMQKELHKQMAVILAVPLNKEGKRVEIALGARIERVVKAHGDAMWARMQEENVKRDKADRDRLSSAFSNFFNKDLPVAFERTLKKEITANAPAVAKQITPYVEKAVMAVFTDGFQKSLGEKISSQLEKIVSTRLEASVSKQLQTQFHTAGRQILQDSIRASFEALIVPAFDRSCRSMFEQVDEAFQQGMAEHTAHAQQQFNESHSALASTLQDAVTSATSLVASLKGDIADGQRKLVALAENAGATAARAGLSVGQSNCTLRDKVLSLQHVEEALDPTIELSRLVSEDRLEEAFNRALSLSDVAVVSWLCTQIDPEKLFTRVPLPLSQGVLLSLVQQLGCELGQDTTRKLTWIQHAALLLNPNDPLLAPHMRPFLEQLYQNLHRQMVASPGNPSIRLVIHLVNSLLTSCK